MGELICHKLLHQYLKSNCIKIVCSNWIISFFLFMSESSSVGQRNMLIFIAYSYLCSWPPVIHCEKVKFLYELLQTLEMESCKMYMWDTSLWKSFI